MVNFASFPTDRSTDRTEKSYNSILFPFWILKKIWRVSHRNLVNKLGCLRSKYEGEYWGRKGGKRNEQ